MQLVDPNRAMRLMIDRDSVDRLQLLQSGSKRYLSTSVSYVLKGVVTQ